MSEAIFVNIYIEKLLKEMGELQKKNVLLQAQMEFLEKQNETLKQQLDKYQKADEKPVNGNSKRKKEGIAPEIPKVETPKMEEGSVL